MTYLYSQAGKKFSTFAWILGASFLFSVRCFHKLLFLFHFLTETHGGLASTGWDLIVFKPRASLHWHFWPFSVEYLTHAILYLVSTFIIELDKITQVNINFFFNLWDKVYPRRVSKSLCPPSVSGARTAGMRHYAWLLSIWKTGHQQYFSKTCLSPAPSSMLLSNISLILTFVFITLWIFYR